MSETYSVFCKMPDDKRGEYSEEIVVRIPRRSVTLAKRAAQEEIDKSYVKELKPVRVVWRPLNWF
jgi:hypothetical protein